MYFYEHFIDTFINVLCVTVLGVDKMLPRAAN